MSKVKKLHRVVDPQAVYPICAVEVRASTESVARVLALEAMMGCHVDDVDQVVVKESLQGLSVFLIR